MLRRKALEEFAAWRDEHGNRALLVSGARQVGKTYLVREFLHAEYENVVEFDLVEQGDVRDAFDAARNVDELFMAISAFAGQRLVPGKTAIFSWMSTGEIQGYSVYMTNSAGQKLDYGNTSSTSWTASGMVIK